MGALGGLFVTRRRYVGFLQKVNIFETLSKSEVSRLAEVVQEEDFEEDEAIIEQGEVDNSMYITDRRKRDVGCAGVSATDSVADRGRFVY